jgi:hypothetical protein
MANEFKLFSKITLIKILAIIYVTFVYAIGGLLITIYADRKIIRPFYDTTEGAEENISTTRHFMETVLVLCVLGVLTYIGRNVLQKIPFPLDGVAGFEYMRVPEVITGGLLGWTILIFSGVLDNKIKIINSRLSELPRLRHKKNNNFNVIV